MLLEILIQRAFEPFDIWLVHVDGLVVNVLGSEIRDQNRSSSNSCIVPCTGGQRKKLVGRSCGGVDRDLDVGATFTHAQEVTKKPAHTDEYGKNVGGHVVIGEQAARHLDQPRGQKFVPCCRQELLQGKIKERKRQIMSPSLRATLVNKHMMPSGALLMYTLQDSNSDWRRLMILVSRSCGLLLNPPLHADACSTSTSFIRTTWALGGGALAVMKLKECPCTLLTPRTVTADLAPLSMRIVVNF
jgi:hypothetical protein